LRGNCTDQPRTDECPLLNLVSAAQIPSHFSLIAKKVAEDSQGGAGAFGRNVPTDRDAGMSSIWGSEVEGKPRRTSSAPRKTIVLTIWFGDEFCVMQHHLSKFFERSSLDKQRRAPVAADIVSGGT
jgi:hypothetical protein